MKIKINCNLMRKIKLTFLLGMFLASLPAIAQTEEDAKNAALDFLKQKKGNKVRV